MFFVCPINVPLQFLAPSKLPEGSSVILITLIHSSGSKEEPLSCPPDKPSATIGLRNPSIKVLSFKHYL